MRRPCRGATLLLGCLCLCAAVPHQPPATQGRADALVLALQWPPARLQGNPLLSAEYGGAMAEGRVASSWTIHGLWPSSGNGPTYCGPSGGKRTRAIRHPGAEPALVPTALVPSLNYMWPDITPGQPITSSGGQPLSIWQEEWATHGTCYSSDSATYLLDAVRVAVGIRNLTDVLAGAGIVPSASRPYRVGAIKRAISAALGDALPPGQGLVCRLPDAGGSSLPHLAELRLCIDRATLAPADCNAFFPPFTTRNSCGSDSQRVMWLPLPWPPASSMHSTSGGSLLEPCTAVDAGAGVGRKILLGLGVAVFLAAAGYFIYWVLTTWPISRLFKPSGVTVIHNPLVRQPMQILSEIIDLEEIAKVDRGIAAVAGELGYGMGIKGGIARKILKILHGTPEPATDDFDIDCVLIAEAGLTPEEETELRKTVTGMQLGHLILEPKDVEVLSKEGLKSYWIHRDICLNEVLLLRLSPGAPLTLFYSDNALYDAKHSIIRSIPHALKSDFTECWTLDGAQPILSPKHVARTILRYFKGHGASYQLGEDTWAYYRRNKLQPITLYQILRAVHADDVAYRAVVAHLIDVGLLSGSEVRRKGGFDGLWGSTLKEVNDKLAQYGGRLSLDELDVEAVERWVTEKKARMRSLPYRQRDRASRTGYIPADEDTLSLGLITFPSEYLEFVDGEGGLWDPEHPAGSPPPAGKGKANQLRQPSRQPIPGQLPSPLPAAGSSTSWAAEADVEAAMGSEGSGAPNGGGALGRLASFGGAIAAKLSGRSQRSTGTGLEEPLLSSALLPPGERPLRGKATPASSVRHAMSALWQGGGGGGLPPTGSEVQFVLAQTLLGAAPAVSPDENRLGMAWEVDPQEYTADAAAREEDKEDGPAREPLSEMARPASRYSSAETIHFMCRIGMAAWPLLVLSSVLVVASVGLHLYQLRVQSLILNLALAGDSPAFMEKIVLLAKVCIAYVTANWLSSLALQLYLRQAMQQLYTGLFQHVLFQDSTFYDRISASELAMRCGVDMMNLRVLVGFLVQKMVKGLTQVIAGVVLLASFASPALGWGFTAVIGAAVWVSVGELFLVSLFIRARHRIARSALGRLYGFSYDVFSSIHGVISMALQRSFADSYGYLAASYFHAAMVLAMWVASHEFFLETLFSAGVTVGLMYIGGSHVLAGTLSVGALYAMLRYTAVVESGYTALSEGVARFYASYGSLEHVIDLQKRGQLTNRGKAAVLEALEREDANRQPQQEAGEGLGDAGGSGPWPNWTRRLTAASWAGGVRCRDVIYGYKGRPGNVLFAFNLDVPAGELVLVTGAPASGRSTLLHLLHLDIIAGGGSVQFLTTAGTWLTYQTTSTDRYDMQQCMGYVSPQSCIEAVFYATVQENMVCGCSVACLPSVVDCQEAAAVTGLDADVAQMPDGYQTLVGEASRVDLAIMARLRLGITRLLLLDAPRLVLIDDADRFLTAVPRLPEVVGRLKQAGASVVLTASSSSADALRAALPTDMHHLVLERGRLRPAV